MKKREKEIITRLLREKEINFKELKENLNISRRTLYYDIDKLNIFMKGIGRIIIRSGEISIVGDYRKIQSAIEKKDNRSYDQYLKYVNRKRFIFDKIFSGFIVTSSSLASAMYVSHVTIKDTIKKIKTELLKKGVFLTYKKGYHLLGSEKEIRELFLAVHYELKNELNISPTVNLFNDESSIRLTDNSKSTLSAFVSFVCERINKRLIIDDVEIYQEIGKFDHFDKIPKLFPINIPHSEQVYMSAFVSSLPCLNTLVSKDDVSELTDKIIDNIEDKLMIFFKDKEDCKKNISRHIASSYYRIKYQFPIHNPLLEEIKFKFTSLFTITKNLFNSGQLSSSLKEIRDEEVAYIVSYLGAYLFKEELANIGAYRVLIASPEGISISKTIEYQLERYFPQVKVIDAISLSEIETYENEYDFLISTIQIEGIENLIVVNPLLRNFDLDLIGEKIFNSSTGLNEINIDDLIEGINKYSIVEDEKNLRKFLYSVIYETNISKREALMLKETLLPNRIKFTNKCENWESAIFEAALPLLEQGTIKKEYVKAMVDSVNASGPYIVLDDFFALAHARPSQGVNTLSMSLLKINEAVDFLGKEVKIIVVLAAIDNKKHLKALSSLTEIFMDKENIRKVIDAKTIDTVVELIEKHSY